jgi:excisionase family DNA binding protein
MSAAPVMREVPTYLTVREAAGYLRVSEGWLYKQAETRSIPCVRIAGRRSIRFRREDLDRWMKSHLDQKPEKAG